MAANSVMVRNVRPGARDSVAPKRTGMTVNEIYEQLKQMAVLYQIRPGERVNELELAERFDVSRTPIREALNRLVAENLLAFVPNRGFFIRELDGKDVFDLFELRRSIESTAVMLACERASDNDIKALRRFWKQVMKSAERMPSDELVVKDEQFHLELAAMSGKWGESGGCCRESMHGFTTCAGSTSISAATRRSPSTCRFSTHWQSAMSRVVWR